MWIDFKDGYLVVVEKNESISSVNQNQLRYFGFSKKSKWEYIAQTDLPTDLLEKILEYFSENDEDVELSGACKDLLKNARTKKDYFNRLLIKAQDYKNGNFDNTEFKEIEIFSKDTYKKET